MLNVPKNLEKYRLPSLKDVSIYCSPDEYEDIFSKTKILKGKSDSFLLPPLDRFCSTSQWKVPELEFMKLELIRVKSLLNSMKINEWHSHTRSSNPLSSVIKRIRNCVTHEFCSVAWCKLFEILSCHNALPDMVQEAAYQLNEISLDSVHLCEAPGAFISATNHFLQTYYESVRWNWVATTLNPYYEGNDRSETLIQDQIILSTMDNWTFFDEDTGNIMKVKNIKSLKEDVKKKGLKSVQLITADGSVDCADAPDEQENITSGLHYCEMMAALEILGRGGTFVLKLFTFFECNTICKLYILSCFFDEVHVVKPAMSKEGNSEVYMICRGFVGPEYLTAERQYLLELCDRLPEDTAIFPLETIPPDFIKRVIQCSHFYATLQAEVILRNVKTYKRGHEYYERMKYIKEALADQWFQSTGLVSLPQDKFLLHLDKTKQKFHFTYTTAWEQFSGSYNERISRVLTKNQPAWLESLRTDYEDICQEFKCSKVQVTLPQHCGHWKFKSGKPFDIVKCSRFCSDRVLQLLHSFNDYRLVNPLVASGEEGCSSCEHGSSVITLDSEPPTRVICYSRGNNSAGRCVALVDFLALLNFLKHLWATVNELLPSQCLFICDFPLLTRLSFGFAVLLRSFFESGDLIVEPKNRNQFQGLQGILFKNFLGQRVNRKIWSKMQEIINAFNSADSLPSHCFLEVLPITVLCARKLCRDVTQYNNHLLLKSLQPSLHSQDGE